MKKRFLCLLMALAMLASTLLLTGCSQETNTEDATSDVKEEAEATADTITMFMITDRHVYTQEELDEIKTKYGETSREYIEAKGVKDAYANVAAALDKITKAKFRTHLVITFYTEEEYVAVEKLMELQDKIATIKAEAKKALRQFTKAQKAMGIEDTAVIQSMFYEQYPEYAEYTDVVTNAADGSAEAETIVDSYGIQQLKYPDVKPNQVDIVCVCGYDKYLEYVDKEYLHSLDAELDGNSKAIITYVNEKFLKAASLSGGTYAIPNNTTIGEYTYLLINKDLYNYYEYDYDDLPSGSKALYSDNFLDFLKDIQNYEPNYTPITGDLSLTNDIYWSLNYEYTPLSEDDAALIFSAADLRDKLYYYKTSSGEFRLITPVPNSELTYATVTAEKFEGTEFALGTLYYTKGEDGYYTLASEYKADTEFYTLTFKDIASTDKEPFNEFQADTIYFVKTTSADIPYLPIYTWNESLELYTVNSAEFDYDTFNILGDVISYNSTLGTQIVPELIIDDDYKKQLLSLEAILEKGYYDADALNNTNKKFATAIVKGDSSINDIYGDEYYMTVLEYPKADVKDLCEYMFAVSSSSNKLDRAMQVITYINTNIDFRNLLQYGVEGQNYELKEIVDEVNGKTYKVVHRLDEYYKMNLYATGNTFIAYPEETMSYKVWDYGKTQNADAVYNPMIEFNLMEYIDKIDFTTVDYFKKLSEEYAARINACETEAELKELLSTMSSELSSNVIYRRNIEHGISVTSDGMVYVAAAAYNHYSIMQHYMDWWVSTEYFVPTDSAG